MYLTKFQELLDLYFMKKLFWPPRMVIETTVWRRYRVSKKDLCWGNHGRELVTKVVYSMKIFGYHHVIKFKKNP